jgi:hypothetical protein
LTDGLLAYSKRNRDLAVAVSGGEIAQEPSVVRRQAADGARDLHAIQRRWRRECVCGRVERNNSALTPPGIDRGVSGRSQ